ncbi:MAG: hypothetical protein JNK85_23955 [Verrucomicrobiales bacterium]|nr:hypothetical protein [Verrucomicrobiales bacterium]
MKRSPSEAPLSPPARTVGPLLLPATGVVLCLLFAGLGHPVLGQPVEASYQVTAAGGGISRDDSRTVHGTVGQLAIGASTNTTHAVRGGFWRASQVLFPPTLHPAVPALTMVENSTTNISLLVEDYDSMPGDLTFEANASNPELILASRISVLGADPWSLQVRPLPLRWGEATASITVTDDDGQTHTALVDLTVEKVPLRLIQVGAPGPGCGDSLDLAFAPLETIPIRLQWRLNGVNLVDGTDLTTDCQTVIAGTTSSALAIRNFNPRFAGLYSLVIETPFGTKESEPLLIAARSIPSAPFVGSFPNPVDLNELTAKPDGMVYASNDAAAPGSNPLEPLVHAAQPSRHPAWFAWRAPRDPQSSKAIATFRTQGSAFDTVLAIYTFDTNLGLREVAHDDESGEYHTSLARFAPEPGRRYLIAVDGVGGQTGLILLSWALSQEPAILSQPDDVSVNLTTRDQVIAQFEVEARDRTGGTTNLTFEWQVAKGDGNIYEPVPSSWASSNRLAVAVTRDNAEQAVGIYRVVVIDRTPPVTRLFSEPAILEVIEGRPIKGFDRTFDRSVDAFRHALSLFSSTSSPTPQSSFRESRNGPSLASPGGGQSEAAGNVRLNNNTSTTDLGESKATDAIGGGSRWAVAPILERESLITITTEGSTVETLLEVYQSADATFEKVQLVKSGRGTPPSFASVSFLAAVGVIYLIRVDSVAGQGQISINAQTTIANVGTAFSTLNLAPRYDGPVILSLSQNGLAKVHFIQGDDAERLFDVPFVLGTNLNAAGLPDDRWVRFNALAVGAYALAVERSGPPSKSTPAYASPLSVTRDPNHPGSLRIQWKANGYRLETTDQLGAGPWIPAAATSTNAFTDTILSAPATRYYRLRSSP